MKFKAKKRVILSDFEPFLTLKFAKKMFSRAILPCRAVAKDNRLFKQPPYYLPIAKTKVSANHIPNVTHLTFLLTKSIICFRKQIHYTTSKDKNQMQCMASAAFYSFSEIFGTVLLLARTLRTSPTTISEASILEPPQLIKGSGMPVTGARPMHMPIFSNV